MLIFNIGGDILKTEEPQKSKNLSKASNRLLKVCQPIKDGFNEALKDSSKVFFSTSLKIVFVFILNFFINLFK